MQLLLRKKAAEELKKEQERKAAERRRIIEERCGKAKDVGAASEGNASGCVYASGYFIEIFSYETSYYPIICKYEYYEFSIRMICSEGGQSKGPPQLLVSLAKVQTKRNQRVADLFSTGTFSHQNRCR